MVRRLGHTIHASTWVSNTLADGFVHKRKKAGTVTSTRSWVTWYPTFLPDEFTPGVANPSRTSYTKTIASWSRQQTNVGRAWLERRSVISVITHPHEVGRRRLPSLAGTNGRRPEGRNPRRQLWMEWDPRWSLIPLKTYGKAIAFLHSPKKKYGACSPAHMRF